MHKKCGLTNTLVRLERSSRLPRFVIETGLALIAVGSLQRSKIRDQIKKYKDQSAQLTMVLCSHWHTSRLMPSPVDCTQLDA